MATLAPIQGSMVLDPSAYIAGLNQAAGATRSFQQGVSTISFAGFNRGIFATTTLLYGLERIISRMSQGMEEYANMLGRIGTVADMTAASVGALANSMKSVSVFYGTKQQDTVGGMYSVAQAGYSKPSEMRAITTSAMRLSRAAGGEREISTKKAAELTTGLMQALGLDINYVKSGRLNDLLLYGRDVGKWELNQMAPVLGKVATVHGNQFTKRLGSEETLRQVVSMASLIGITNLPEGMVATALRRLPERTFQLAYSKRGDPLRQGLRGLGYKGANPILDAYNEGNVPFLRNLNKLTGGDMSEIYRLGYQSREFTGIGALLRQGGSKLEEFYAGSDPKAIAGKEQKYLGKTRATYDFARDQLRAQWSITSQEFMQASIPLIEAFTGMLQHLNRAAQSLPDSVKSLAMLMSALVGFRLSLNYLGFRTNSAKISAGGLGGAGKLFSGLPGLGDGTGRDGGLVFKNGGLILRRGHEVEDAQAARLVRRQAAAARRSASWQAGFGGPSDKWAGAAGMPWGTAYTGFKPMSMTAVDGYGGRHGAVPMGPAWYNNPRQEPMNWWQSQNMMATSGKWDAARNANNRKFWAPNGNPWIRPRGGQSSLMPDRQMRLMNAAALAQHYMPGQISGAQFSAAGYGPSAEQRIRWAAYKKGQSVNFDTGSYGSLSPNAQSYFGNRGQTQGSLSVREQNAFAARNRYYGSLAGTTSPIIGNMRGQMGYSQGFKMMTGRDNMERVLGSVTSGLSMFGAAIMRVLGPMALLTGVLAAIGSFFSGWNYAGRQGEKEGGLTKMKGSGGGFMPILDPFSFAFRSMGSAANNGSKYTGEIRNEYGREHNYLPIDFQNLQQGDIPGYKPGMNKKWWLLKEGVKTLARGTPLGALKRAIFPGENPLGLEGYRRVKLNDVMRAAKNEQLSETEVTKFQKMGIDFNDFETGRKYLNDYAKELGNEPPKDWQSLVQQTKDGLSTYGQMAADAFRFAAKKIEDAGIKAAAELENASIKNRLMGYTANVGKYIGFVSGQETLMNLEGMQKTPFQPEKGAKWLGAYQKALGVYSGIYDTPRFKDKDILAELAGIEDVAGKDATKGIEKPFNDVLGMNARLTGSDFFARYGPQLGNAKLVSDEMIANAVGLDKKNMSPELTKSILGQIRGLDYTSWTQTFEPQKAPFSQALQYGTREGYDATLDRKEGDPVVQILRSKLDAVISAIVAKERDDDQKQSDFAEALGKVISEAMKPLAENELKNQDLLVSKLDKAWFGTITDPIVSAINVLGAGGEMPRV